MRNLIFILLLVTVNSAFSAGGPSFSKSKKALAKSIYVDHKISFYCDCDYSLKPKQYFYRGDGHCWIESFDYSKPANFDSNRKFSFTKPIY